MSPWTSLWRLSLMLPTISKYGNVTDSSVHENCCSTNIIKGSRRAQPWPSGETVCLRRQWSNCTVVGLTDKSAAWRQKWSIVSSCLPLPPYTVILMDSFHYRWCRKTATHSLATSGQLKSLPHWSSSSQLTGIRIYILTACFEQVNCRLRARNKIFSPGRIPWIPSQFHGLVPTSSRHILKSPLQFTVHISRFTLSFSIRGSFFGNSVPFHKTPFPFKSGRNRFLRLFGFEAFFRPRNPPPLSRNISCCHTSPICCDKGRQLVPFLELLLSLIFEVKPAVGFCENIFRT